MSWKAREEVARKKFTVERQNGETKMSKSAEQLAVELGVTAHRKAASEGSYQDGRCERGKPDDKSRKDALFASLNPRVESRAPKRR